MTNLKIINDDRHRSGFITVLIEGRWVQAKVFNARSHFGINDGRVSKLAIGKTDSIDSSKDFFNQISYNYDRGLDFDKLNNDKLLNTIIQTLDNLPQMDVSNTY